MPIRMPNWLLIVVACLLFSAPGAAEQKKTLGQWDVHYIVVNTAFLTPQVAQAYGIVRSKYSALVNISVLDKQNQQAQNVDITGTATNLLGKQHALAFRKVEEGEAIYYLANIAFDDMETFRFVIDIKRGSASHTLKFQQKLYAE
ncbi:DUF4426 domain-containing protein [Salinimonas sediminis]|uniref:DUF4426 domain-containing protein n=1 Tax=Salinimonas sediminis TaxID=2303538 RepID=A0A346NPR7_9ALTE|nr:DUF4426 domain-containing protein [Salinimonas sediminis]AXR07524.1 DUF4426 domain-containing protein [Salinimonas sediminis]